MQPWFREAKLGVFVHWGVYSVDGVPESWPFYTGLSHEQYMGQLDGFTASRYDPRAWAELFARAGARYAVLTARHHDEPCGTARTAGWTWSAAPWRGAT